MWESIANAHTNNRVESESDGVAKTRRHWQPNGNTKTIFNWISNRKAVVSISSWWVCTRTLPCQSRWLPLPNRCCTLFSKHTVKKQQQNIYASLLLYGARLCILCRLLRVNSSSQLLCHSVCEENNFFYFQYLFSIRQSA